jgi:hypothetical protein
LVQVVQQEFQELLIEEDQAIILSLALSLQQAVAVLEVSLVEELVTV